MKMLLRKIFKSLMQIRKSLVKFTQRFNEIPTKNQADSKITRKCEKDKYTQDNLEVEQQNLEGLHYYI